MAFDNTKYDVEINGQGYRVFGGIQKSEQSTFIPRLGSGDQTESEFNLLRSKTINGFEGGIMQRNWKEDNQVFNTQSLYPSYDDGVLYPTFDTLTLSTSFGTGRPVTTAITKTKDYQFHAWQSTSGGLVQGIYRLDTNGTMVSLGLPLNLSNGTYTVTDMVIWRNELWVCASDVVGNGSMYYMPLTSSVLTDITGGLTSSVPHQMCIWKDQLYGTNTGPTKNSYFHRYTGDKVTKAFLQLAFTPMQTGSVYADLFVFNNRIFLTRHDGMYAYDGVNLVTIEDLTKQVDEKNFRFPCVLKGYMYYFMPDGMYRFNGSMIEKMYDINEMGFPKDMCVGKNCLWMAYTSSASSGVSRFDKASGTDHTGLLTYSHSLVVFNGKGLYLYQRSNSQTKSATPLLANEGEVDKIYWFNEYITSFAYAHPLNYASRYRTNEITAPAGTVSIYIITSIFDGGFPMVDKAMHNLELTLDGTITTDETLTIEYRVQGFDGSYSWASFGTFSTITGLQADVWKNLPNGITWKRIQFRITGVISTSTGIAKLTLRYVITPDFKWQWQFIADCTGDDRYGPQMLADGSESTSSAALLRHTIYEARDSDQPLLFVDVDQLDMNGSLDAAVTSVVLNNTRLLKGQSGFIKVDDEIMYYTAKTATTLTVLRGKLGTTAATHADNAKVFPLYRVYIVPIQNERIELQDKSEDATEDKSRDTQITLILKEV